MARIITYNSDKDIDLRDKVVGTEFGTGKTKNYEVSDLRGKILSGTGLDSLNTIITKPTILRLNNNITIKAGGEWQIEGQYYTNLLDKSFTITSTVGVNKRIDLVVLGKSTTPILLVGVAGVTPNSPTLQSDQILLTSILVSNSELEFTEPSSGLLNLIGVYNISTGLPLLRVDDTLGSIRRIIVGGIFLSTTLKEGDYIVKLEDGWDVLSLNSQTDGYYSSEEVNTLIGEAKAYTDSKVTNLYKFKGSVADYLSLPSSNNIIGDVWNLLDTEANYAWTGTGWDSLGGLVDLSTKVDKVEGERLINELEIDKLSNTSGINTGDQDLSSYETIANNDIKLAGKANLSSVIREPFTYSGSQLFPLANTVTNVYSVTVRGVGLSLSLGQYQINSGNILQINDTLETVNGVADNVEILYNYSIGDATSYTKVEEDAKFDLTLRKEATSPNSPNAFWSGTQAQYDAIGTKSATTIYFVE